MTRITGKDPLKRDVVACFGYEMELLAVRTSKLKRAERSAGQELKTGFYSSFSVASIL